MRRPLPQGPRWWLALLMALTFVATLAVPVAAAPAPVSAIPTPEVQLLQAYKIVRGDENGYLNLDKPITRAEMITIMVRVLGAEAEASAYKGWGAFTDIKGHWAEGNIIYAAAKGMVKGDDSTGVLLARPNDKITYGEALTLVLRLIKEEPTSGSWPLNILLAALDLGLLPAGLTAGDLNSPAIRSHVFGSLATAAKTATTDDGRTYLQAYVDSTPPTLSLDPLVTSTKESHVRVSGTVQEAESVTVNGLSASITGLLWAVNVPLEYGENKLTVIATDPAGNTATSEKSISRIPPIASLTISGPAKVRPKGTATYAITALDSAGKAASLNDVKAEITGNIGTFQLSSGLLTASGTPGKGKITLSIGAVTTSVEVEVMGQDAQASRLSIRSINDGNAVAYTKPMTVVVEVQDANGQFLDTDYGRSVTLSTSGLNGLSVSPAVAFTEAGLVTFTVTTAQAGTVNATASTTGLAGDTKNGLFGTNLRIRLSADPNSLMVGGSTSMSRIQAVLVDANNNQVTNTTGSDLVVTLTKENSDAYFSDNTLIILKGHSSSSQGGDEGMLLHGATAGTATIRGSVTSGPVATVDPTTVTISVPQVGSGTKLQILGPGAYMVPGVESIFYVRLVDTNGNVIPTNSYAFQLQVDTSNNETKTNGIPEGVTIQLGSTGLNPVYDGKAEGATDDTADVIARTAGGLAVVKVTYNKPGKVTLTPVVTNAYANAYSSDGVQAIGNSSTGFGVSAATAIYQNTPTKALLTATSTALGTAQSAAALSNSSSQSVTLNVTLTDANNYWTPGVAAQVTLVRDSGSSTQLPANLTATTSDGKASFTVAGTTTTGTDLYKVTATVGVATITSNTLSVAVQDTLPATPTILAIRGVKDGVPGQLNYVSPDDTGIEIDLDTVGTEKYVQVLLYRESSSLLYSSDVIDISSGGPRITVPKEKLTNGSYRYQVSLRNGKGEGTRSSLSSALLNATYSTGIIISSARFDAATDQLYVYGSGFSTGDTVTAGSLSITDASTSTTANLAGAVVTISHSGQIIFDLTGLGAATDLKDGTKYAGSDITLAATAGWLAKSNGTVANADTANKVTPGAHITHALYDRSNNKLYLSGEGFTTGNVDYTKLKLTVVGGTEYALSTLSPTRTDDSTLAFSLTSAVVTALDANGAYVVTGAEGWFYDSTAKEPATANIQIYAQISLSTVTYAAGVVTIKGSGFTGGTVTVANLSIQDLSAATLVLTTATPAVVADDTITVTLTPADVATFEDVNNFKGSDIYLQGSTGWFTNALARSSAAIPSRALRFPNR